MLTCFGMIWNCDNFSRWNTKFVHFQNFVFIQNWLSKKWYIGTTINIINKKFQNISLEKSSLWKHVSLVKGPPMSQPHFGQVWGWNSHSQSWGFGVLRDSRMFRVQQQGEKHLALGCSWCHWKGLEVYMSEMASHWSFGHLQPK
jgi:hypothetical protein